MPDTDNEAPHDVRMRGFARRHTVDAALAWLDAQLRPLATEGVRLSQAAGRVLGTAVESTVDVPGFDRSTMDGYAVVAADTEGASPYNRVTLKAIGDALPGAPYSGTVRRGTVVRIMTGAPLPGGADAVLPAEWAEREGAGGDTVAATATVSPGKHVGRRGEDVRTGTTVLAAGRLLRPQDVGVLSSIGVVAVPVVRRPRVRLVITGNELLPAGSTPHGFHIADANGPMLAALAERDGAIVSNPGVVRDLPDAILAGLMADADVVIVSGGSSVGLEDLAPM